MLENILHVVEYIASPWVDLYSSVCSLYGNFFLSWQYVSAYIHKTMSSKHLGGRVYKQVSCVGSQKVMDGFNIEALCLNISERAGQGGLGWCVRPGLR